MLRGTSNPEETPSKPRRRKQDDGSRGGNAQLLASQSSIVSGLQSIRGGSALSSISSRASSRSSRVQPATKPQDHYDREIQLSQLEYEKKRLENQIATLETKQYAEAALAEERRMPHGLDSQKQSPVRVSPRHQEPQSESGWPTREFSARYKTIKKLKGGAMAVVYLAKDIECAAFHREVILKLLLGGASYEQRQRFIREVRLVGQIRHPNVVQYHDVGEQADGTLFIAMEVLQGTDLQVMLDKVGRIEQAEAMGIAVGVLSALESCHALHILHRDVKPANVVFHPPSNQLKLIDFGLAKHTSTSSDLTGDHVVGTPMYFAPEQTRSDAEVTPALDLWAVGVLLFHCVTGTLPFAKLGDSLEVIVHEIRTQPPRDMLSLAHGNASPPLIALVDKALVKDPAHRVQSAKEMKSMVIAAMRDVGPTATTPLQPTRGGVKGEGVASQALRSLKGDRLRGDSQVVSGLQDDGAHRRGGGGKGEEGEGKGEGEGEGSQKRERELQELRQKLSEGEREKRNLQRILEEARHDLRVEKEKHELERREREREEAKREADRSRGSVRGGDDGVPSSRRRDKGRERSGMGGDASASGSVVSRVSGDGQSEAQTELERLRNEMREKDEELERVFEELAGKEIELEDAKEQLTSLKQSAESQLEEAAEELGQVRQRAEEAERQVLDLKTDTGPVTAGKSVAWGEDYTGKQTTTKMGKSSDESTALVKRGGTAKGGSEQDAMALVPSSERGDRRSRQAARQSSSEDEEAGEEDAREVDRLKYQRFTRDREIERLRGEVGTLRGMVGQKDRDIKTLGREMELKDAELRSTRAVEKRDKHGAVTVHECKFLLNGDTNGVFYLMGSTSVGSLWQNPARLGLARVLCGLNGVTAMNGVRQIHAEKEDVLERSVVCDSFAFNDGWFIIDLDPRDQGVTMHPTYYTLRNGGGKGRCLTGWVLEGSDSVEQNAKWKTLDAHQEDESFLMLASETGRDEYPHHSLSWLLHAKRSYRTFRVRQKSNHWGSKQMFVQGFELYGLLRLPNTHPAAGYASAELQAAATSTVKK